MSKTTRWFVIGAAAAVLAAAAYAFTAPYERFPGVLIGGAATPPPADWNTANDHGVVLMKLAGFPPFVIRIVYSTDAGGVITATRPDGGYWAGRVRSGRRNGWIRLGDATYALAATEIVGDERIPYTRELRREERDAHGVRLRRRDRPRRERTPPHVGSVLLDAPVVRSPGAGCAPPIRVTTFHRRSASGRRGRARSSPGAGAHRPCPGRRRRGHCWPSASCRSRLR